MTSSWDGITLPIAGGVSIAFGSQAFNPNPTWNSQLPGVQSFTIDRGRSYELSRTQTGTATVNFYDVNGTYDATNPNGPYYLEIGPMRLVNIQLQNPTNREFYSLFTGFTESWNYSYPATPSNVLANVAVDCVDGFDALSRAELPVDNTGYAKIPAFGSGMGAQAAAAVASRIAYILGFFSAAPYSGNGYPTNINALFSGNVIILEAAYNPQTALLTAIQDTADAEFPNVSNVFMDKWGNVAFRGRGARFTPAQYSRTDGGPADIGLPPTVEQPIQFWNVGDYNATETFTAGNMVPFTDYQWNLDQTNLVNACQCYPGGLDTETGKINAQLVTNGISIEKYGPRVLQIPNLYTGGSPSTTGNPFLNPPGLTGLQETLLFGQSMVDNFNVPQPRVSSLTFVTQLDGTIPGNAWWHFVTGVEIGDVITLYTSTPGGGGFSNEALGFQTNQFFVEGLHYSVTPGNLYPQVSLSVDVSPRAWSMFFNGYQWFPGPIPPGVSAVPYALYGMDGSVTNGMNTFAAPSGLFYSALVGASITITLGADTQTFTIGTVTPATNLTLSGNWTGTTSTAATWSIAV